MDEGKAQSIAGLVFSMGVAAALLLMMFGMWHASYAVFLADFAAMVGFVGWTIVHG